MMRFASETVDKIGSTLSSFDDDVLMQLLCDQTSGRNIIWCTDDYRSKGCGFGFSDEIVIERISGDKDGIVRPRALKSKAQQRMRTHDKAEVFTPSWVCNAQNNLIDSAWFNRENVFNIENPDHTWTTVSGAISFPESKSWEDYVFDTRLEMACGEAPYLVSRYDTTTGTFIPVPDRIGLLDRKMRVICENVDNHDDWLKWTQIAYQNIYGFEWQGDNLLLARLALLQTLFDYHSYKFESTISLQKEFVLFIAYIISWNLWQMDGLKGVIPNSCREQRIETHSLFGNTDVNIIPCAGCANGDIHKHNGSYCLIRDWSAKTPSAEIIKFVDLLK